LLRKYHKALVFTFIGGPRRSELGNIRDAEFSCSSFNDVTTPLEPLWPIVVAFGSFDRGLEEELGRERQHDCGGDATGAADFMKENVAAAREAGEAFDFALAAAFRLARDAPLEFASGRLDELRWKTRRGTVRKIDHVAREDEREGSGSHRSLAWRAGVAAAQVLDKTSRPRMPSRLR
jgi:hypothetical protein